MAKKSVGPAVKRNLLEDIKRLYPQFADRTPHLEFSKVGDLCEGTLTFFDPGVREYRAHFRYHPSKSEHRLDVYKSWLDDTQR